MKQKIIVYSIEDDLIQLAGLGYNTICYDQFQEVLPDTHYLAIGYNAYAAISSKVHYGLRGAKYGLITYLPCVKLHNGSCVVHCYSGDWYINKGLEMLLHPDLELQRCEDPPEEENIKDTNRAIQALWELHQEDAIYYGYDYESHSFPDKHDFILTGLGISSLTQSKWFDFRFIDVDTFNHYHKLFLNDRGDRCVVFNVNFELQASYVYLGEYWDYKDLNIVNIVRIFGNWCNLKWTARRVLNIASWDDEFDSFVPDIEYYFDSAYQKRWDKHWDEEAKVYLESEEFKTSKGWNSNALRSYFLTKISEEEVDEMEMHLSVVLSGFYAIPSRILGKYCCKDTWYTLQSWMIELPNWKQDLIDVYSDGKLLESRLNNQGMIKDIPKFNTMINVGDRMRLLSGTPTLMYYLKCVMDDLGKINDINAYSPSNQRFIKMGYDVSGDKQSLAKSLWTARYVDENYEWSYNINAVYEDFGTELGDKLTAALWSTGIPNCNNLGRKISVWRVLGAELELIFDIPEELQDLHYNTVQWYLNNSYLETIKSLPWVGVHYEEMSPTYEINGETYTIKECISYLLSYVNFNSPNIRWYLFNHWWKDYTPVALFNHNRYFEKDEAFRDKYTGDMQQDFITFQQNFHLIEPEEQLVLKGIMEKPPNTWMFDRFKWLEYADWHYPGFPKRMVPLVEKGLMTGDLQDFYLIHAYLVMWPKYTKTTGTYVEGQFYANDTNFTTLDKYWVSRPYTGEWDATQNIKSWANYEANKQFSMRWSSGFHTLPGDGEVKQLLSTPNDGLLYYFDISAAEIRSCAFISGDRVMIKCYEDGLDLYVMTAEKFYPDYDFKNDPGLKSQVRTQFKQVLISLIYGMGDDTLADNLAVSTPEAKRMKNAMLGLFPRLAEFIEEKSSFPANNEHKLDTILGELIESWEDRGKMRRHGINTVMQGFTAVALVHGFYNILRESKKIDLRMSPVSVVHDSTTMYFDVHKLQILPQFLRMGLTDFLFKKFGVPYEFTLKVGTSYYDTCEVKELEYGLLKMTGTGRSFNQIFDKYDLNGVKYKVLDAVCDGEPYELKDNRFEEENKNRVSRFLKWGECSYMEDTSYYYVTLDLR